MVLNLDMDKILIEQWGVEYLGGVESSIQNTMSYAENKAFFSKQLPIQILWLFLQRK